MGAPTSPYAVDWNYGVMPTPGEVRNDIRLTHRELAVIVPGVFVGSIREKPQADDRWLWMGCDDSLRVASDGRFWCQTTDGERWSSWEETNVWWVEVE